MLHALLMTNSKSRCLRLHAGGLHSGRSADKTFKTTASLIRGHPFGLCRRDVSCGKGFVTEGLCRGSFVGIPVDWQAVRRLSNILHSLPRACLIAAAADDAVPASEAVAVAASTS